MDETTTTTTNNNNSQISSFLLGHLLSSSTATNSSSCAGVSQHKANSMPFSSYSSSPALPLFVPCSGGASTEKVVDAEAVLPLGYDSASFLHRGMGKPPELVDFDGYDCESEEGVEVPEEPARPATSRNLKRSRAAQVHNLSEKRRRSRINEKMKALQNLIPNSNKTDKASMLDEAIEYLKQLQLQVQMLSMRNELSLHPMYFPGALQPLQASRMRLAFGEDDGPLMNMGGGMLPMNLDSAAQNSFEPSNRCMASHQSILPSLINITNPENSFGMAAPQSHPGSFHLSMAAEDVYTEAMVPEQQLDTGHTSRNPPEEDVMKSMAPTTSLHYDGPASILESDHLEAYMSTRGRSQDVLSKDQDNQILNEHLHGLQTGRSLPPPDVKTETVEY